MKSIFSSILSLLIFSVIVFFCSPDKKASQQEKGNSKPAVAVVNYPLYSFADMIGGDKIEVFFPEIDGDPAYWQPDEAGIEKFQNADLILLNGADYAKWTGRVSLPASTQVNTSKAFFNRLIEVKGEAHSHGPDGEHSHTGYAFTTWLDMKNAALHAEAVKEALADLIPEEKDFFITNNTRVQDELNKIDSQLSEILGANDDLEVFASHPVYQYLAKGYNINIISYHWEPDQMPLEESWKEFEHELDHHTARAMLWEDEPLPEIRKKLEEMSVHVIVFNPGGNRNELDFISLMSKNVENLKQGLN
jgi:zinc transport system substrate-binding protein